MAKTRVRLNGQDQNAESVLKGESCEFAVSLIHMYLKYIPTVLVHLIMIRV